MVAVGVSKMIAGIFVREAVGELASSVAEGIAGVSEGATTVWVGVWVINTFSRDANRSMLLFIWPV
jgi:hypothetical protein